MFQVSVVPASWALDPRGTNQARAWNSALSGHGFLSKLLRSKEALPLKEKNSVEECLFNTWNPAVTTVSFPENYTDNELHYDFTEVKVLILSDPNIAVAHDMWPPESNFYRYTIPLLSWSIINS